MWGWVAADAHSTGSALMLSFSTGKNVPSCVTPPTQMKVAKRLKMRSMIYSGRKTMMMMMTLMKTTL